MGITPQPLEGFLIAPMTILIHPNTLELAGANVDMPLLGSTILEAVSTARTLEPEADG